MQKSKKEVKKYFARRFGVQKDYFNKYSFYKKSDSIWATSQKRKKYQNYKIQGIRALRKTKLGKKPTTYFLQLIGEKIKQNIFNLNENQFEKIILNREPLKKQEFGYGYIAFKFNGDILGCGLQNKNGIRTQIPKGRTKILRNYWK